MKVNKNIIVQMLQEQFNADNIELISEFNDGYAKRTFKISINHRFYLLQIWDEPDHLLTKSELKKTDDIYRQSLENLINAKEILDSIFIKTPKIIYSDGSKSKIPYEFAILEFITGGNLFDNPSKFSDHKFISDLGNIFGRINCIRRNYPGLIVGNEKSYNLINSMLKTNLENITIGANYNQFLNENKSGIKAKLEELSRIIQVRNIYSLIHGDFKPNHFIFNDSGETVLIDCDGLQFFDVEYEIAQFMIPSFAFSNCSIFMESYYRANKIDIDDNRLLFYKSCHAISGLSFCSEYLQKYKSNDKTFLKVIESNEESIKKELLKSAW